MAKVVLVRLREMGMLSEYSIPDGMDVKAGDYVIIEVDRGLDWGEVQALQEAEQMTSTEPIKAIIREATYEDLHQINENKIQAKNSFNVCNKKIKESNIGMKLIQAEYSFDAKKVIFYFTSEARVDFRELVKELAKVFKMRIEMRQVGVRDEAKFFGGVGACGRCLCCNSFLRNFEPVTIKMAKNQKLSLNPTKISGICGRLMCCLSYEHPVYKEMMKDMPKEGQIITTDKGKGKVIEVNPLRREIVVELENGVLYRIIKKECESCPNQQQPKDVPQQQEPPHNAKENDNNADEKSAGE